MTERIDHVAEAREHLQAAKENPADATLHTDPWLLAAQVHATLALVEQQRIANLIAYWQLHTPRTIEENGCIEVSELYIDGSGPSVDTQVREGLGL